MSFHHGWMFCTSPQHLKFSFALCSKALDASNLIIAFSGWVAASLPRCFRMILFCVVFVISWLKKNFSHRLKSEKVLRLETSRTVLLNGPQKCMEQIFASQRAQYVSIFESAVNRFYQIQIMGNPMEHCIHSRLQRYCFRSLKLNPWQNIRIAVLICIAVFLVFFRES